MKIEDAAEQLGKVLRGKGYSWFVTAGVGVVEQTPTIFVYRSGRVTGDLGFIDDGYEGHPVVFKHSGKPKPA